MNDSTFLSCVVFRATSKLLLYLSDYSKKTCWNSDTIAAELGITLKRYRDLRQMQDFSDHLKILIDIASNNSELAQKATSLWCSYYMDALIGYNVPLVSVRRDNNTTALLRLYMLGRINGVTYISLSRLIPNSKITINLILPSKTINATDTCYTDDDIYKVTSISISGRITI